MAKKTFEEQIKYVEDTFKKHNQEPEDEINNYNLYGMYDKSAEKLPRKLAVTIVLSLLNHIKRDYELVTTKYMSRLFRKSFPLELRKSKDFSYDDYPAAYIGWQHTAFNFNDDDGKTHIIYFCDNILMHFDRNTRITEECLRRNLVTIVAHERLHYYEDHVNSSIDPAKAEDQADAYALSKLRQYDSEIYNADLSYEDKTKAFIEFLKRL